MNDSQLTCGTCRFWKITTATTDWVIGECTKLARGEEWGDSMFSDENCRFSPFGLHQPKDDAR
jgi:hypothetical protein